MNSSTVPRVSVVMPVYNTERYLAEAIESVLAQTLGDFELVLVDDHSTDGSWEIARAYSERDPRVRVFRNDRNRRIVETRNRAFAEAHPGSEFFAVLDSDDVCLPQRLQQQVEFLDTHPDHALVGGHILIIDENSREVGTRRYPTTHEDIVAVITRYNPIAQPTAMFRRSILQQVGNYDRRYGRCQDYDLWLRIAATARVANLDEFTLRYRVSATQGKSTELKESLRMTIAIQRKWLFKAGFFRPLNVAYWGAEHLLLALPGPIILGLFKRMTYGNRKAG